MHDAPRGLGVGDSAGVLAVAAAVREVGSAGAARTAVLRLFAGGAPVAAAALVDALGPGRVERLVAAGALEATGEAGELRPAIALSTFDGLLLAHDRIDVVRAAEDAVVGVGPAPRVLAWLTPQVTAGRVLDVATGCGVHALLAARRGNAVVATDVSARALAFAGANARMNGIHGVELRAGDLFAPVAGELFDLIVANPPFVVSPGDGLLYRDGGLDDDEMSARVVGGLPQHLEPGGLGVTLCNWVQPSGEPWWFRPRSWCAGAGCDVLLLRFGSDDVGTYVRRWNKPLRRVDAGAYRAVERRWLAYYEARGIATIGAGAVVLRRRVSGRVITRVLDAPHAMTGPAGEQVVRVLDAASAPSSRSTLRQARLRLAQGFRTSREQGRTWARLQPGLGVRVALEGLAARIVPALDGRRLQDVLDQAGASGHGADVVEEVVKVVRRLVVLGMVEEQGEEG